MKKEKIVINRRDIWILIDPINEELSNGFIQESENKFICFYSEIEPTVVSYGKTFKDSQGNGIIFKSYDEAKNYAIDTLKKEIYPEHFEHPLIYNPENISEIMNKSLIIDLGIWGEDEITETINGKIITWVPTNVGEMNIAYLRIEKQNKNVTSYSIMEIKGFRKP